MREESKSANWLCPIFEPRQLNWNFLNTPNYLRMARILQFFYKYNLGFTNSSFCVRIEVQNIHFFWFSITSVHETANYSESEVWVERILSTFWYRSKVNDPHAFKAFEHAKKTHSKHSKNISWFSIQEKYFIKVSLNYEKNLTSRSNLIIQN